MKDKRVKAIITQLVIPFAILVILVCVMLVHYSVTSRAEETKEVEDFLYETVEHYALRFNHEMNKLTVAAESLADFMGNYTSEDVEIAQNLANAIVESTDCYLAVMCNIVGEGMTHTGERVNIYDTDYFIDASGTRQQYVYSEDDGIIHKKCAISVVPLTKGLDVKGFLLVYYDAANLESLIKKMEFDSSGYYAVVDEDGTVICEYGAEHAIFGGATIWDSIYAMASNTKELEQAQQRFDKDLSGIQKIEITGSRNPKALIYAPIYIDDWKMVIGMNYSYIEILNNREWKSNQILLVQLIVCMLLFVGSIVVIAVVSKLRQMERNKTLANKADTDLLTGLNNKAATERKIRTYMEEHPDEQSLLFVLDIDNFKKINDTMGHAFGDEVLRSLGQEIRAYFRFSDVIGRTGGDEFMIFLKGMKDDEIIMKEARKLDFFFKNFQAGDYVKYSATASIGAAVFPRDAADFESLYKAADKALYKAKQRGKNQIAFYDESPLKT